MANALEAFGEATLDPANRLGTLGAIAEPFTPVKTADAAVGQTSADLGPARDSPGEFPELGEADSGRGGPQAGAAPNPELFPRLVGPAGPIAPGIDRRNAPVLAGPQAPELSSSTGFTPEASGPTGPPRPQGTDTLPPTLLQPLLAIISARQRALG